MSERLFRVLFLLLLASLIAGTVYNAWQLWDLERRVERIETFEAEVY